MTWPVKKVLTIGLSGVALAATLSFVGAGSHEAEPERLAAAETQPVYDIRTLLSGIGLSVIGEPVRRGHYFVMHAYDPRGVEVRVVADAQFGDVLSVTPVLPLVPPNGSGPRIIHVPQPGARDDEHSSFREPSSYERDEPAMDDGGDAYEQAAPPPRVRATPKPRKRSDTPPAPRRAVLNAPPPSADRSLTPIYPTPRFKAPVESGEKFGPPKEAAIAPSDPPPAIGTAPPPEAQPSEQAEDTP